MKFQKIFTAGDQPRPLQVLLPARLVEELRFEAARKGVSMAFLIRSAIERELSVAHISIHQKDEKVKAKEGKNA